MTVRILLVDRSAMVRQGLRLLLEAETDLAVVGESDNGFDVLDTITSTYPTVLVMDLASPGSEMIAATQRIHAEFPKLPIVTLSSDDNDGTVVSAVRAGAIGVVSKTASIGVLIQTIRAAADGQVLFSAELSARLVQELRAPVDQPERLTERELEVLGYVAEGLSNKQVAWQLSISEKTVKSHVSTILSKLGLESRTQAALHAERVGLVSAVRSGHDSSHRSRERSLISLDSRRSRPPARLADRFIA